MAALEGSIQVWSQTAASWTSGNPTLRVGQIGFESDTGKFKIGDGSTAWNALAYQTYTIAQITALLAGKQDADSDLTAIAGLSPTNDDIIQRKAGAWTNRSLAQLLSDLGLGALYQALDSDLTAIAALSPSNDDIIQRKAGAWTNRTIAQLLTDLGLGALYQPLDSDLTAIAALTTTSYGRALLTLANAAAADWTSKLITANRQTDSYTLVLGDADKIIEMNKATANNLTVPANSSVAYAVGTQILIAQYGAGQTTVVASGGVTIRSSGGKLKLTGQYSGATLIKIATDEWYLFGDISA